MNTWSQAIVWYRALLLISSCVARPVLAGKPKNRGSARSYSVRWREKGSYDDRSPNAMAGKNSNLDSRTSSLTTVEKGTQIYALIAQIGRNNKHSMFASTSGCGPRAASNLSGQRARDAGGGSHQAGARVGGNRSRQASRGRSGAEQKLSPSDSIENQRYAKMSFNTLPSRFFRCERGAFSHASAMDLLSADEIRRAVQLALAEDVGSGDITTLATIPASAMARAVMIA